MQVIQMWLQNLFCEWNSKSADAVEKKMPQKNIVEHWIRANSRFEHMNHNLWR